METLTPTCLLALSGFSNAWANVVRENWTVEPVNSVCPVSASTSVGNMGSVVGKDQVLSEMGVMDALENVQ